MHFLITDATYGIVLFLVNFSYIYLIKYTSRNGSSLAYHFQKMILAHIILTSISLLSDMLLFTYEIKKGSLSKQFKIRYLVIEFLLLIGHLSLSIAILGIAIKLHTDIKKIDVDDIETDIKLGFGFLYSAMGISIITDLLNLFKYKYK